MDNKKLFPLVLVISIGLAGGIGLILWNKHRAPAQPTLETKAPIEQSEDKEVESQDIQDIRAVFQQYREALLESNGQAAAELVDAKTIQWYGNVLQDALFLEKDDLLSLDILKKFTVLRLRQEFKRDELEAMTGRGLFILAVNQGWISQESVEKAELAEVKTENDYAVASIKEAPTMPAFYFIKEDGQWRLALWQIFPLAIQSLEASAAESGLSEEEFVFFILEQISGTPVNESILEGPLP